MDSIFIQMYVYVIILTIHLFDTAPEHVYLGYVLTLSLCLLHYLEAPYLSLDVSNSSLKIPILSCTCRRGFYFMLLSIFASE